MNKVAKVSFGIWLVLISFFPTVLSAQTPAVSLCAPEAIQAFFFNGIRTSFPEAEWTAIHHFPAAFGRSNTAGERITYAPMYNQTDGAVDDIVETFEQRLSEQSDLLKNKFELFYEGLVGGGPLIDWIVTVFPAFRQSMQAFSEYDQARRVALLASLLGSSDAAVTSAEQNARIDALTLQGSRMVFIAHSQGNLFANSAYDHALTKVSSSSVKVVHIAPASPRLVGPYTLANLDLVINGLRPFGTVAANTTDIPGYALRGPGRNGNTDFLGHGVLEIYLNESLSTNSRIVGHVKAAVDSVVAPPEVAESGFFNVTLTWNGTGDVDLHAFEPLGAHVYYASKVGQAGFLDVDNVVANGPEHYYASCDTSKLQTGVYIFALNNYANAQGRTATVQVASVRDGVLTTKQKVMGPALGSSGNSSPSQIVSVTVTRNSTTGEYKVTTN